MGARPAAIPATDVARFRGTSLAMLERTYLAPADVEREEPRARLAAFSFAVE